MFTTICFTIGPIIVAVIVAVFCEQPREFVSHLLRNSTKAPRVIAVILAISGALAALCVDILDVSDLLSSNSKHSSQMLGRLHTDLETIFELEGSKLESLRSQLDELFHSFSPPQSTPLQALLGLGAGTFGGLYLLILVYHTSAEKKVSADLRVSENRMIQLERELNSVKQDAAQELLEAEARCNLAWKVSAQIETIVVAKLERLKRASSSITSSKPSDVIEALKKALAVPEQYYQYVIATHGYFERKEISTARLVVSLYVPCEKHLQVVASTDGKAQDVVKDPNDKFKACFSLGTPNPASLAVKAFGSVDPIICNNCLEDANFIYFGSAEDQESQKAELQSAFACPLKYPNNLPMGVLFAHANVPNYFNHSENLNELLKQIGSQLALRMMLEDQLQRFFSKLNAQTPN